MGRLDHIQCTVETTRQGDNDMFRNDKVRIRGTLDKRQGRGAGSSQPAGCAESHRTAKIRDVVLTKTSCGVLGMQSSGSFVWKGEFGVWALLFRPQEIRKTQDPALGTGLALIRQLVPTDLPAPAAYSWRTFIL